MPDPDIYAVADRFKRALIAGEGDTAREVRRYYRQAEQRIAKRLEKVIGELEQWQREHPGEGPPAWWVFERDRLQVLQGQAEQELARFAARATARIETEQRRLAAQAEANAEALARAGLGPPPPGVTVTWARLPKEALEQLVGTLQDGSPLRELFDSFGPAASEVIRDALVNGLALGVNPREVARWITGALNRDRLHAETIARTEMLRSYREASRASYLANSDVVKGWVWHSAADERTCEMCWAMHGTEHALEEHLDDHPRGRCAMLPLTRTWKELGFNVPETRTSVESGESLFAKLSEEQQRAILGNAGYEAYKAGAVKLSDFVGQKSDPRWGTMRYARSLKEILGAEEAKSWRTGKPTPGLASVPRSLGAAANKYTVLQATRINEMRATPTRELDELVGEMRDTKALLDPAGHFKKHGARLGCRNEAEYTEAWRRHLLRTDLTYFTAIRTRDQDRMWYLVAMDNGDTALYNESRKQQWSFLRSADLEAELDRRRGHWVRVQRQEAGWRVEPW